MKAIILDGHLKSALTAVRSLGLKGVEFSVGAERKTAPALHSVHAKETFVYTSPLIDKEKFITELEKEAKRLGRKPLLYTFSDATFISIIRHRERLEKVAIIILPDAEYVEQTIDKSKTLELATSLGIRTPKTHTVSGLDGIAELSKDLHYPAVVKPRRSAYWKDGEGYVGEVRIENNAADLTGYVAKKFIESGEMPLIQNFAKGDEYGVELLADKGDVRAVCVHKRIRSVPPMGGASVVKETVGESDLTTLLKENAFKLAAALMWNGVMIVEFKIDEKAGEPVLMEINGRFWGSLPIAVFAGVNFPYMYFELAQGKQVNAAEQENGVISRHFLGDLQHLLYVLFARNPMRKELLPRRWDALKSFMTLGGVRYDVFQKDDIKPFLMEMIDSIVKLLP